MSIGTDVNEHRYSVGDHVIVRDWHDMAEEFGDPSTYLGFVTNMRRYCGREMVVKSMDGDPGDSYYGMIFRLVDEKSDDGIAWHWTSKMVRPADNIPAEEISDEDCMAILQG